MVLVLSWLEYSNLHQAWFAQYKITWLLVDVSWSYMVQIGRFKSGQKWLLKLFCRHSKGQLISKPIYDLLTSPKKNERTNLICLLFYSSRQTNQIRRFVFWENLRLANLLFEINWPLAPVFCFAEVVSTGLWTLWSEQHAPYAQYLPRPARKESNVPNVKCTIVHI